MKKTTFITALTLILLMTAIFPVEARTRRAVVIGLGEQLDKSWGKINGDRDVPLITGMLKENGFSDITTLVNSKATKAGIVNAFKSLINRSQKGDVVYIHFSGHGQMMTDLNGDEQDGLDEAWIPYDAYMRYCARDRGEKHLSDDEVAQYMSALRTKVGNGGVIAVVVDACHSGDSTRDLEENDSTVVIRGVDEDFRIPGKKASARGSKIKETWLTLSACQDFQLNQEYMGFGKLTHILANNWRGFADKSDAQIFKEIGKTYETRQYKGKMAQNPKLSGKTGKVLSVIFGRR